jgi:LmbE family N-acetylglucosaminyl deacetylase
MAVLGIPPEQTRCLDFSEVEIYRRLSELYSGKSRMEDVRPLFAEMRAAVRRSVFDLRPDAVFTQAWQGGQPEHDLVHFFTLLALRDYERETGLRPDFFHLPAYEYTILVAMRFHPLYPGERIRLRLTPEELAVKMKMVEAYPSQVRLFEDFRKVFRYASWLGKATGGPRSIEDYFSIEEFGPVPAIDYTARPHWLDYFTYMFDDFEGVPVTFTRSVRPIVREFLNA